MRPISIASLEPVGRDLHRPECVLPVGDRVLVSDWRGGVTEVHADGTQQTWLGTGGQLRPNGIGLTSRGTWVIAHLGDSGGVFELSRDGAVRPLLVQVDGVALPPTNFATYDAHGRLWVSISTRHTPRQLAWRPDVRDGFIAVVDRRGARIVADTMHYTNEVRPDPTGRYLYAVETFGKRLTRFEITPGGELGHRETVLTFSHGCFPDGFAFDEEGGIWITSLISNRVLRFHEDRLDTIAEDLNADFTDEAERAFTGSTMNASHLGPIPGTRLQHATSIGFGGADGRTAYLGSLHTSCVYRFHSPVAGIPPTRLGH